MNRKNTLLLACLLPFTSGLVNSMGLRLFEVVVTNVAGHFGTFLQQIFVHNYAPGLALLVGVMAYGLGAFGATLLAENAPRWSFMPVFISLGTVALLEFGVPRAGSRWVLWLLFGSMGAYNAVASNLTQGQVKPSQLTGLLIDACTDAARVFSGKYTPQQNTAFRQKNQVRWLVILFFSLGVLTNAAAWQWAGLSFTLLPLLFLVVVAGVLTLLRRTVG